MELINSIENTSRLFPAKKTRRKPRKHIIKYIHVIDDSGSYIKTQEVYHLSWQRKLKYNNIDIYSDDSFKGLRKSFEKKDSLYKGTEVEIVSYKEKQYSVRKNTVERVPIYSKIILDLPQINYSYDEDDKEFFRMRSCQFDNTIFPCEVSWTQERFRNSHYLYNIDMSQVQDNIDPNNLDKVILARFDENSLYVYINQAKMKSRLKEAIQEVNYSKSKANYELHKSGDLISVPLKNKALGKCISILFGYSMYLFYINTSHGWKYEDLSYELLWNLAMLIMQQAKPFGDKEKIDWLEGVTVSRVRYLFSRKLFNISTGIESYLIKNVCSFSERIHEKNLFTDNASSNDKLMFKLAYSSKKKQEILERNKKKEESKLKKKQEILERNLKIKEMYSNGCSCSLIASKYKLSLRSVYSILKS